METLEERRLLATLPLPDIAGHSSIVEPGAGNYNTPSIAYDPSSPERLVAVYTFHAADDTTSIGGGYSVDGGLTWSVFSLPGNMRDPMSSSASYSQATEPSVAFDLDGNFYITYVQHSAAGTASRPAGAVVLQKYAFVDEVPENLDPTPADGAFNVLYQWVSTSGDTPIVGDAAYNPILAVDNTHDSFSDPDTGETITNPHSGNVYVAWSLETGNSHNIVLMGSRDGGAAFTRPQVVNDVDGAAFPRMTVSQGTADGRVVPGQLNIIWDAYADGVIRFDRVIDGAWAVVNTGPSRTINDGTDPDPDVEGPHNSGVTTSAINVSVPPGFVADDVDVELYLTDPNVDHLLIELVHGGRTLTLVRNRRDNDNNEDTSVGITGTGIGVMNGGRVGAVFDDEANRSIHDGGAPYVGRFLAEGNDADTATSLAELLATGMGGTWTLRITDHREDQDESVPKELLGWSLRFSSVVTTGADITVVDPELDGAFRAPFANPQAVMADRGYGPGATIASDNTLGSFSPYQGRLYLAYADYAPNMPRENTDIFLMTSDDGGFTWSSAVRVNDDNGAVDGFSEGLLNTRPHFQPEVAVDQTTGTLVVSFYDARHDAARTRVARYIATSIDGGLTFGPQIYANEPNRVIDAVTGLPVDLGPIPDNQSAKFDGRDKLFSYGDRQGLAVVNGRINLAWSGNRNAGNLGILGAVAHTAAGPRIVQDSATMGPVSLPGDDLNPANAEGLPQFSAFEVVFDRPVDPATFTLDAVTVLYRDIYTSGNQAGVVVPVATIEALDEQQWGPAQIPGATRFLITLATPQTGIGTYSYFIAPVVRDRIRTAEGSIGNLMDQNADATAGEAAVPGETVGDLFAIPRPTSDTAYTDEGYLAPPFDQGTLPIIVPGPRVTDTSAIMLPLALRHPCEAIAAETCKSPSSSTAQLSPTTSRRKRPPRCSMPPVSSRACGDPGMMSSKPDSSIGAT